MVVCLPLAFIFFIFSDFDKDLQLNLDLIDIALAFVSCIEIEISGNMEVKACLETFHFVKSYSDSHCNCWFACDLAHGLVV